MTILSGADTPPQGSEIRRMFGRIAAPYDFLNRAFSMGIDLWWRRRLAREVRRHLTGPPSASAVLDLACGSGDVLRALRRAGLRRLIGADFCLPMLLRARKKIQNRKSRTANTAVLIQADALHPPFAGASFDAVTIAFGYRNFEDRAAALREIRRVLRTGGHLHLLEFSQPVRWLRPLYFFHLKHVMPLAAGLLCRDGGAYAYLARTASRFPSAPEIGAELEQQGFSSVSWKRLTFGIVALHTARA